MSSKFNPWEDSKTFIQDVGNFPDILEFINKNNIDSNNELLPFKNNYSFISLNNLNDYSNSLLNIELLEELNKLSKIQYNKLEEMDVLYSKYKYELLLSQDCKNKLNNEINELTNIFEIFKNNKIKLVNLLHNSGLTEQNIIKIKHNKKMELIKILKICTSEYSSILDMIELNENLHKNTIEKLKNKIINFENLTLNLDKEFNEIKNIQNNKNN